MKINEKIYNYRKDMGIRQEDLSERLGVSRQTISKWENGLSYPEVDKIVALCDIFGITTDELLRDTPRESKEEMKQLKNQTPLVVSISVFLYFLSIIWIIISTETFRIDDGLCVGIFLIIAALPTILLIYHFMSRPKVERRKHQVLDYKTKKVVDSINSIIAIITTIVYLLISFSTSAWHITWIIWIVYGLVSEIIELIFILRRASNDSE